LRLFCFPYAGGGASVFHRWSEGLPGTVDVCAVQLPGRENRLGEPARADMLGLARETAAGLRPFLELPFAFFGHSMGARLSFEIARVLRSDDGTLPVRLLVSAGRAPQVPRDAPPLHALPEADFVRGLRERHNVPEAVLRDPELRELFLPLLRADFAAVETYLYVPEEPLSCPIFAFGGLDDSALPREHLEAWREQTSGSFRLEMISGDHFFVVSRRDALLQLVSRILATDTDSLT
jgi:medium-chain acyl-[acyl-carrier-protein] hydrolase